jgi:hypothetical protein
MGTLTDMHNQRVIEGNTAQLINTVTDLKSQYQTLETEIPALITQIKQNYFSNGGILPENYAAVAPIFQELAQKMFTYASLTQRKVQYKAQLQELKPLLESGEYQGEVQVEIDSL